MLGDYQLLVRHAQRLKSSTSLSMVSASDFETSEQSPEFAFSHSSRNSSRRCFIRASQTPILCELCAYAIDCRPGPQSDTEFRAQFPQRFFQRIVGENGRALVLYPIQGARRFRYDRSPPSVVVSAPKARANISQSCVSERTWVRADSTAIPVTCRRRFPDDFTDVRNARVANRAKTFTANSRRLRWKNTLRRRW